MLVAALSLSGMSVFAVAAELWDRVAGTQPAPPVWVVAVSGAAALLVVLNPQAWHLARNAITIAHEGGHAIRAGHGVRPGRAARPGRRSAC